MDLSAVPLCLRRGKLFTIPNRLDNWKYKTGDELAVGPRANVPRHKPNRMVFFIALVE